MSRGQDLQTVQRTFSGNGLPHYADGERTAIELIQSVCNEPRHRWYIRSIRETSATEILAGNPMTLTIATQPGHSGALRAYDIPPFNPVKFKREIEQLASDAVHIQFVWHPRHLREVQS